MSMNTNTRIHEGQTFTVGYDDVTLTGIVTVGQPPRCYVAYTAKHRLTEGTSIHTTSMVEFLHLIDHDPEYRSILNAATDAYRACIEAKLSTEEAIRRITEAASQLGVEYADVVTYALETFDPSPPLSASRSEVAGSGESD